MENQFIIKKSLFIRKNQLPIHEVYEINPKEIGSGAYGNVFKAKLKAKANTWRAIKQIKKRNIKSYAQLTNEIQILTILDHPNVVRLYETFQDKNNIYLVTDYFEGGQIFERLQKKGSFSEDQARQIFRQAVEAIAYCHNHKVSHRDLKPQNFMFLNNNSPSTKLIDFGLAFKWQQNMKNQLKIRGSKLTGSIHYMSPEMLKNDYDEKCDVWSLGVLLYILITANFPFDAENEKDIKINIECQKFTTEIQKINGITNDAKDLLKKLLVRDSLRYNIQEIFKHPWMNEKLPNAEIKLNFRKMANFAKFSKLKTLAVSFIASQLPQKQIDKIAALFKQIDVNHDGYLSIDELQTAFMNSSQKSLLQELNKMMQFIDTDKNGKINYTQFITSCLDNSIIFKEENLMAAFKLIDKDGNGKIQSNELKHFLSSNQSSFDLNLVEEMIKSCDKNGDGIIDYKQFVANVSKL